MSIVALLMVLNERILGNLLDFWQFRLAKDILFEQEIICLISELFLQF